jgi:hypothetical protein
MGRLRTFGRARRDAPKHLARLAPRQYRVGFRNSVRGLTGGLGWRVDTFALP